MRLLKFLIIIFIKQSNKETNKVSLSLSVGQSDLVVCGVLSGNGNLEGHPAADQGQLPGLPAPRHRLRPGNLEGRIQPLTRANYLASPPLVITYALAGTVCIDFQTQPLGRSSPWLLLGALEGWWCLLLLEVWDRRGFFGVF